ncbi:MAG: AmmeMemoRadiSam system protein B [Phycisphaerales bacterium]
MVRESIVAGQFYPGSKEECQTELHFYTSNIHIKQPLPEKIVCGIVPHAGWVFSGDVAGMVFKAIEKINKTVDTFVIFGATHSGMGNSAAVYDKGSWRTPMGEIQIDEDFAAEVLKNCKSAKSNSDMHKFEHSIEVQIPFIQYLFKNAKIVPIMTTPAEYVIALGLQVGQCIRNAKDKKIVCIGSTDLTHYGPRYGFSPKGKGSKGLDWARNVNDKNFIDNAIAMDPEKLLIESMDNQNACGPGAAAATIAVARELGRTKGIMLAHTHSNDVMERRFGQTSEESVGYTGIIY